MLNGTFRSPKLSDFLSLILSFLTVRQLSLLSKFGFVAAFVCNDIFWRGANSEAEHEEDKIHMLHDDEHGNTDDYGDVMRMVMMVMMVPVAR